MKLILIQYPNIYAAINLKCVGASIGEKPPLAKKLPGTTTVFIPINSRIMSLVGYRL